MRAQTGRFLAMALTVLLGLGHAEAACRAGGEYRVTGPASAGSLVLSESTVDDLASSGSVALTLAPKQACPVCLVAILTYPGEYHAVPVPVGNECALLLNVRDPVGPASPVERTGSLAGRLAFGGPRRRRPRRRRRGRPPACDVAVSGSRCPGLADGRDGFAPPGVSERD